jgi:hypothetical protein
MRHLLPFLVLAFALADSPLTAAGQEVTPSNTRVAPPAGYLAQARREFNASGTRLVGTSALSFIVAEFDTDEHAEAAVPLVSDVVLGSLANQGTLAPTSAPTFGDSTVAYTGKLEHEDYTFDAAMLTIRDGRYVHVWFAAGLAADPLLDLTTLAERLLQDTSQVRATPEFNELLNRLPTLRDLPTGFVLGNEVVEPAAQSVGTPSR